MMMTCVKILLALDKVAGYAGKSNYLEMAEPQNSYKVWNLFSSEDSCLHK